MLQSPTQPKPKWKMQDRKPTRAQNFDYSAAGYYFITICTHKMICHFGRICNARVRLNAVGEIAAAYLREIPEHFSRVELDETVVMPNHVHAILILNPSAQHARNDERRLQALPKIIGQYKSSVTREIRRRLGNDIFAWQTSYHDCVPINGKQLLHVREYIRNNPLKWELDKYHPRNRR